MKAEERFCAVGKELGRAAWGWGAPWYYQLVGGASPHLIPPGRGAVYLFGPKVLRA